jgi:flagellar L-ring protein precursor FlgH
MRGGEGFIRALAFGVAALICLGSFGVSRCGAYESLYADTKAGKVGDVLTVVIMERTLASNTSKLSTGKETKFGLTGDEGTGGLDFIPGFTAAADMTRGHDGAGSTQRSGSIVGRMAAVVQEVNENGCLVIRGQREIMVNDEKEVLIVTGLVRPEDISTGNLIYSTDIANAQIIYKGKGLVSSGSKPSIIARIVSIFF